jgi:hypothetical protein
MHFGQIKHFVPALLVMLLLAACSKNVDSETVAYEFVRLYFVEDNMAEAVKLSSGSARAKLEGFLREIEAVGAKEPAIDKPLVKAELLEMQPVSQETNMYIYRVTSDVDVQGMQPVTAKLWLRKAGETWLVSKFVQEE